MQTFRCRRCGLTVRENEPLWSFTKASGRCPSTNCPSSVGDDWLFLRDEARDQEKLEEPRSRESGARGGSAVFSIGLVACFAVGIVASIAADVWNSGILMKVAGAAWLVIGVTYTLAVVGAIAGRAGFWAAIAFVILLYMGLQAEHAAVACPSFRGMPLC